MTGITDDDILNALECLHALETGAKIAAEVLQVRIDELESEREWLPIDSAPMNRHVLLCYLNAYGKHRTIVAVNAKRFMLEASEEYLDGEYCEEMDDYFLPAGWYERSDNIEDCPYANVDERAVLVGWQPIPQPPKVKP